MKIVENSKIKYYGPLYGEQKEHFFETLDYFLFPSEYANETQGIVNIEALKSGVTVVSNDIISLTRYIPQISGLVVRNPKTFVEKASHYIARSGKPSTGKRAQNFAAWESFRKEGEEQLSKLCSELGGA